MNTLQDHGLRVVDLNGALGPLRERVSVSQGARRLFSDEEIRGAVVKRLGGVRVWEEAVIPAGAFRPLTKLEESRIFDTQASWRPTEPLRSGVIAIDRIPDSFFSMLGAPDGARDAILSLADYFDSPDGIEIPGRCTNQPGLPTVARERKGPGEEQVIVGLHVDIWDGRALRERRQSRNRMCINLGKEDRHLLFVNVPLDTMACLISEKTEDVEQIYKRFLFENPGYPVCRLRIAPREAYIAPTEMLIHDGSSEGQTGEDVTFNLLGYLRVS